MDGMKDAKVEIRRLSPGDIRSDLHNRWSRNGSLVSFDSTHEGFRGLYIINLEDILKSGI